MFEHPGSKGVGQQEQVFFVLYREKFMSIIIKSKGQKSDADKRKQLYTWVGCGLVTVLTLISVIPNMGKEKAPDYSKFSSHMQDLAAMPFGTDGQESSFLRDNPEYAEVSNEELLGSLFSSEDRKERQEKDETEGVPPPPDPEYKEAADEQRKIELDKEIGRERIQKRIKEREAFNQARANRAKAEAERKQATNTSKNNSKQNRQTRQTPGQKTTPQTLGNSGHLGSNSGASSGVTGSTWRYEGKNIKNGTNGIAADHAATKQDLAFAKNMGRNPGLYDAAVESLKGANAKSADSAASSAIDAFQDGVDDDKLAKDEQELGIDDLPNIVDSDLQNDLSRALGDDVNKQASEKKNSSGTANGKEYKINENCIDTKGKFNLGCFLSNLGTKAIDSVLSCVTSGCWNSWSGEDFKCSDSTCYQRIDGRWSAIPMRNNDPIPSLPSRPTPKSI